jgi:hypothetical protein
MVRTDALIAFVHALPVGPAYAPIYAKGEVFGRNDDVSTGKAPHEQSFYRVFSPSDVALLLEEQPKRFQAVGLFTGIRSDGLVILDVDANLSTLLKKWGDTIQGAPRIESTKPNAAKFVFRVPEEQRSQVKGLTGKQSGKGYEVLWGMQGVIGGAYPGSSDGTAPAGTYRLVSGDFGSIPSAPEWLLAEMRARKSQDTPLATKGLVKNRRGLDFSGRTQDEIAEIVHDCLQVLPHLGRGSEDYWWQIGAMVAEVLPNDLGLTLWTAWSANDPAFEDDWAKGDPCEAKWRHIVARVGKPGNVGLGSLIKEADRFDPKRERFQDSSRRTIEEVESTQVQRIQAVALGFEQVIVRAREILELDNPAEMNYKLHALAVEAGYRDKEALERLLIDQLSYETQADTMSLSELLEQDFQREYIIPDLLPKPAVVLVYGAGGDGKSMTAWSLAKHVGMGLPFVIRGKHVPVEQGAVLLLNGDQPLVQLQEQLEEVEFPKTAPVTIRTDWSLQRYAQFIKLIEQIKPKLVVIDSLIGCSGGRAFDENKSDFATPLYWLTRNNGVLFPPTTIIIIHHANKQGGFRGTSAIRDAVDEVWALKRPNEREVESTGQSARIITIEKSRSGRGGSQLLLKQEADLCFTLADWTPEVDPTNASPSGTTDRVLQRLRVVYPNTRTRADLNADPLCGGSVAAVRKSLQRLLKRGLIETVLADGKGHKGSAEHHFRAVLSSSRGEGAYVCPTWGNPSDTNGSKVGQGGGTQAKCPTLLEDVSAGTPSFVQGGGTLSEKSEGCPTLDPSHTKGSAHVGHLENGIRTREVNAAAPGTSSPGPHPLPAVAYTVEELDASINAAQQMWD